MSKERWASIKGFEGLYEISTEGRVKSLSRRVSRCGRDMNISERILSATVFKNGYCYVSLHNSKQRIKRTIHSLVASHFLTNENNYGDINHKNGVRTDNRVDNLEWCTRSQNLLHSYKVLGRGGWWEEGKIENHPRAKKIKCDTLDITFCARKEAAMALGITETNIYRVVSGKCRHANGLTFRYI